MDMKVLSVALTSTILSLSIAATAVTPALALGRCGPNGHRNYWGRCVFGGQNQAYCLRRTGHPAVRMPDGTLRCF
jgi:hypothetical protein